MGVAHSPPLDGKSLVIVGGTSGLGLSAAQAFLSAGAHVVVVGRSAETAAQAAQLLGANAHVITGDAASSDTAERAIQAARERFGAFHGLFHVAGGSGRKWGDGPLHELTDEGWEKTLQLNLTSVFYSNRAALRQLLAQGTGGSILNMSSVLGFSPSPRFFETHAYATAKAAIIGMTRAAAASYAAQNIRCNVLAPALVETPMARRAAGDEQIQAFIKTKQPLDGGRIGQPSDLDAAAAYFMSDGSRSTPGKGRAVDGGGGVREGQIPL